MRVLTIILGVSAFALMFWIDLDCLFHGPRRDAAAARYITAAGVTPDPALVAALGRRLGRRDRYDLAGRVLGLIVGGALHQVILGFVCGVALGRLAAQAAEVRRAAVAGVRVTHLVRPRLFDYARPASVAAVYAIGLLPVALAAVWYAYRTAPGDRPATDGAVLAAAGVAVLALLLARLCAEVVLRLRRVAGSSEQLVLDDALRASTLQDLAMLPGAAGSSAAVLLGSALNHAPLPPALAWLGSPAPVAIAAGLLLAATLIEWRTPRRPVASR